MHRKVRVISRLCGSTILLSRKSYYYSGIIFFCFTLLAFHLLSCRYYFMDVEISGWSRSVSRWLPQYIQPELQTAVIQPTNVCINNKTLLIVVFSAPKNWEKRSAIRETWGNIYENPFLEYYVVFLLGRSLDRETETKVRQEALQFNDIIQENFLDSYYNLTLKSIMLLKFVVNHCDGKVDLVFKSDDDVFIYIPNLTDLIQLKRLSPGRNNILVGKLFCAQSPIINIFSKWYCPKYLYPHETYPCFLSGPSYFMSYDVAKKLYKTALDTPFFHLEDVFLTGICANKSGIIPTHSEGFSNDLTTMDPYSFLCKNNLQLVGTVTNHEVSPSQMRQLWNMLKNNKNNLELCKSI